MMSAQLLLLFYTKFLLASTLLLTFYGSPAGGTTPSQAGSIHFIKIKGVNTLGQWQTTPVTVYSNPYTNYKRAAEHYAGEDSSGGGGGGGGGWGQPEGHNQVQEPWTFNYQVIPEQQHHHQHHHHKPHHHHHGWGWKKPHKIKDELDGVELFEVIKGIKLLKIGKAIVGFKLFLLILLLAGVSKTGLILSPVAFPLLALPIAICAKLLFLPLFFLAFLLIAVLDHDEVKESHHGWGWGGGGGWGWSGGERRKRRRRYRRQIPGISLNPMLQNRITDILQHLQKFPNMDFHILPPGLLNRLIRREIKISTKKGTNTENNYEGFW